MSVWDVGFSAREAGVDPGVYRGRGHRTGGRHLCRRCSQEGGVQTQVSWGTHLRSMLGLWFPC